MSGKAYTMKEMKNIVEYLTDHRAYSEIKGRKMWMDLESSKVTNRTWQSLKETFLKRILPDIHNPYYKLSIQQISSFQQGYDIETRLNNKLEIRPTDPESNKNGNKTHKEIPDIINGKEGDIAAGEDPIQSNLRASTETLILENCYETAEDICKDLQSSSEDREKSPTKSMRELITYSEPLTPMLQSVIDDFASDEDCDEPKMQIVEQEEPADQNTGNSEENAPIEISDSEGNGPHETVPEQSESLDHNQPSSPNKINGTKNSPSKISEIKETEKSEQLDSKDEMQDKNVDDVSLMTSKEVNLKNSSEINKNVSNNTTDTLLPGNQEALENKFSTLTDSLKLSLTKNNKINNNRKRASSQDVEVKSKKRVLDKQKSTSDTERCSISENISKIEISSIKQTMTGESTQIPPNIVTSENNVPKEIVATEDLQQDVSLSNSAENDNPCLNSVSLYAEQFSNTKYNSDSETSNVEDNNNRDKNEIKKTDKKAEMTHKYDDVEKRDQINEKKERKNEKKHKKTGKREKKQTKNNKIEKNEKNDKNDAADANTWVRNEDNDMIVLNSHSDSASDSVKIPSKRDQKRLAKQQKERALANVFGFSRGGATTSHRRGLKCRRRTISHKRKRRISSASSDSSDLTSDSGSENVTSPPRCHCGKSRMTRKYIKPKPGRIMSLEEGGLYVMFGKKVYPLVKDDNVVKNFISFNEEDDDDGESEEYFWKLKYDEEKKRTAELTKLLNKEKEKRKNEELHQEPVLPTTTHTNRAPAEQDISQQETKIPTPAEIKPVAEVPEVKVDTQMNTVKIKFIKKNEEVQIEGHWSHLNPVLPHVARLFHKEPEENMAPAVRHGKPEAVQRSSAPDNIVPDCEPMETVELSDLATPVEEFIARVNKREDEIAKEIEEHFKAESNHEMDSNTDNITKRKRRPPSPAVQTSDPLKKMKLDTEQEPKVLETPTTEVVESNENKVETIHNDETTEPKVQTSETTEEIPQISEVETTEKVTEAQKNITVNKRKTRTRKTITAGETSDKYTLRTRRSTSRKSSEQGVDIPKGTGSKVTHGEDNIRYKFPPTSAATRKSYINKQSKLPKKTNQRNTKSALSFEVSSSCENVSSTSETNKEENHDSDLSQSSLYIKKKTNAFIPSHKEKTEKSARQEIHPYWADDTSESNNSFTTSHLKSMTFHNSTLSSEIHSSESYRLLMNKECLPNTKTSKLSRIEEVNDNYADVDLNVACGKFPSSFINCNTDSKQKLNKVGELYIGTDNDNSSNISIPTSPVLSIVENITISKVLLSSVEADDFSPDDKIESNDENNQIMLNELMTPDLDLSLPLMEQECGFENSCLDGKEYHYNLNIPTADAPVSDSLVKKINTINIDDPTLSESLTAKLRDLLLKSSKKSNDIISGEKKDEKAGIKKIKTRKRSSTPRKRSSIRNLKLTNAKTSIEEEHMESCSQISRKSCPPLILITDCDATENKLNYSNETTQFLNEQPKRGRKKKDIIKVKINKPKSKTQDISSGKLNNHESKFTDSGINDTATDFILKDLNDSVDLIHNHSETCLSAHECMGDSVHIIEKSPISMISLNSNSAHSDIIFGHKNTVNTSKNLVQEFFSSDAQDGPGLTKESRQVDKDTPIVYHTPQETLNSPNSLISDDLSDEIRNTPQRDTKWYLLSEEESNTNFLCNNNTNSDGIGYGSRLEQIFPITCAIPDLSTITEASRENGDSKKSDVTNIINNFDSPRIFDN